MSRRNSIKNQIINHLKNATFPITTPESLLSAFPNGADTKCIHEEFEVTAGQAGTLLTTDHFPFTSAEEVSETIVTLAQL